ncbi:RluA family pseudouridine synthase [Patescibacteria group bacterium]|nr:RluA family pseudouridine synthase [Patescibacteria group bacterium]MBU0964663.1 RluA family pseudouridine synthase [Patescibacteria group bacterium]
MPEYKITSEHKGLRLDKFLAEKLPDRSRSQIQKFIKSGGVLVNNKKTAVHQFLKADDLITINLTQPEPALSNDGVPAVPTQSTPQARVSAPRRGLEIITDQPDYLVIDKPAGLLVHEAPNHNEPTLVDLILKKYPDIKKIGEDPMRPGIVHRLDRDVSGLLVVVKTQDMFDHLKSQFKTRQIKKEYLALVYGTPQKHSGEITFNIDRSETMDHKMAAVPDNNRGRQAITEFEISARYLNYTLLKIKPQTGRTHQIRVHLNAYGLPIVGDQIYKPKKLKTKIAMDRIFLHAQYLGFYDLHKKWQEFTLPLPPELQIILDNLKPA